MNATETSQVVHDPRDDLSPALMARLEELVDEEPLPYRAMIKIAAGRVLHLVGIHTWVRHKRYDHNSDGLVDVGIVCWYCHRGRRG